MPEVHEIVDEFTEETYGIMVYQEQVMQIVHNLGGIPLRSAYSLIKAISKKKHKVINAQRAMFVESAVEKGLTEQQAGELFDLILKFAGYGFNKSHSTGYAIVAYQTAYLKTYFPVQYMAALLTYESVNTEKVVEYIDECRKVRFPDGHVGIEVRPPDINLSRHDFTVVFEKGEPRDPNHGHIRFGLGAVKGVGRKAVDGIIAAREKDGPIKSLFDFCERVPSSLVNKAVIEALIKCGAFDALHSTEKRAAMMAGVEQAISRGAQEAELRSSDDFLFGAVAESDAASDKTEEPVLPDVPAWETHDALAQEKAVLGFYVSSHPIDRWRKQLERFSSASITDALRLRADTEVTIGAMVTRVRQTVVKNGRSAGQKMAMLTFEDLSGQMDGVVFSDAYAAHAHLLEQDAIVYLQGRVDRRREQPNLVVDKIIPVKEGPARLTAAVKIRLRDTDAEGRPRTYNGELSALQTMLRQMSGAIPVYFELQSDDRVVVLQADRLRVRADGRIVELIEDVLRDPGSCELIGPMKLVRQNPKLVATENEQVVDRLRKAAPEEEFCDSIDRY